MPSTAPMTAEELLRLQPPHKRTELVDGVNWCESRRAFVMG